MREQSTSTLLLRRTPTLGMPVGLSKTLSQRLHMDFPLLLLLLATMGYGLVVLYSATNGEPYYLYRQVANFSVGLILMFVCAQFDILVVWRYLPFAYLLGVLALVATAFVGITVNGSQRWLGVPGVFTFQPSEFFKLLAPLSVLWLVTRDGLPAGFRSMLLSLILIAIPTVLVLKQPDLGTTIIIAASGLCALFLCGLSYRVIGVSVLMLLLSLPLVWNYVLEGYHKTRILTYLDPHQDPLGNGWNAIQSMIAIGSGGAFGKGWTMGSQAALGFLPESHTDFIFSVLSEEFGYVGFLVLMLLYLAIIMRCFSIAKHAQATISRLTTASLTMILMVYVFINIAMVSGLLPVVGVPLPFISYGGTSVVSILIALGLIMSIATHKRQMNR